MSVDLATRVYRVPTPSPEADGTLRWSATTVVAVLVSAEGVTGLGWTYSTPAAAAVVEDLLAPAIADAGVPDPRAVAESMRRAVRNVGRSGVVATARSAVDIALWDLLARRQQRSLPEVLGRRRDDVEAYGSGGFVSESDADADADVARWLEQGMRRIKIKIGEDWGSRIERDLERVGRARAAAGADVALMVDGNGGYDLAQAASIIPWLEDCGVDWFEEPVSSDDRAGLSALRAAHHLDIAAGEYIWEPADAEALLDARAVDCLQVDVTRCGGISAWFPVCRAAATRGLEVSAHCAPQLSAIVGVATPNLRHVEWFRDHERVDSELFEGTVLPHDGQLRPAADGPGHGISIAARADTHRIR